MRILAALLLSWSVSARAQGASIPAVRAKPLAAAVSAKTCPSDYQKKRAGDCWISLSFTGRDSERAYVHRGGWVVDSRCLDDRRFNPGEFIAGLDAAARKMNPAIPAENGGCLGTFNPGMGRKMVDAVWGKMTFVECPAYDQQDHFCADNTSNADSDLIRIRNIGGCLGAGTTGIGGTIFHETLHAAGVDNWPVEKHNDVSNIPQYKFIYDRVYGTEATCFFGTNPQTRRQANFIQCLGTINYETQSPNRALCEGFGHYYGDMPQWAK